VIFYTFMSFEYILFIYVIYWWVISIYLSHFCHHHIYNNLFYLIIIYIHLIIYYLQKQKKKLGITLFSFLVSLSHKFFLFLSSHNNYPFSLTYSHVFLSHTNHCRTIFSLHFLQTPTSRQPFNKTKNTILFISLSSVKIR